MPDLSNLIGTRIEFTAEELLLHNTGQGPLPQIKFGDALLSCRIRTLTPPTVDAVLLINGVPIERLAGATIKAEYTAFTPLGGGAAVTSHLVIGRDQAMVNYDPREKVYLTVESIPDAAFR